MRSFHVKTPLIHMNCANANVCKKRCQHCEEHVCKHAVLPLFTFTNMRLHVCKHVDRTFANVGPHVCKCAVVAHPPGIQTRNSLVSCEKHSFHINYAVASRMQTMRWCDGCVCKRLITYRFTFVNARYDMYPNRRNRHVCKRILPHLQMRPDSLQMRGVTVEGVSPMYRCTRRQPRSTWHTTW